MSCTIWGSEYEALTEHERAAELNRLIRQWREPHLIRLPPARVIPDTTNREQTGVSLMHVHHITIPRTLLPVRVYIRMRRNVNYCCPACK